jgi:hypothetical protein
MLAIFVTLDPAAPVTVPRTTNVTVLLMPTKGTVTPMVSTARTVVLVAGGQVLPALGVQVTAYLTRLLTAGSENVRVVAATELVFASVMVYATV